MNRFNDDCDDVDTTSLFVVSNTYCFPGNGNSALLHYIWNRNCLDSCILTIPLSLCSVYACFLILIFCSDFIRSWWLKYIVANPPPSWSESVVAKKKVSVKRSKNVCCIILNIDVWYTMFSFRILFSSFYTLLSCIVNNQNQIRNVAYQVYCIKCLNISFYFHIGSSILEHKHR